MIYPSTRVDTHSLLLLKMMLVDSTYHLLQTTTLATDTSSSLAVTSMKLHGTGTDARLYIGTETELYRVPLYQCSEYKSCCECVTSRDPYCAYNFMSESCGSHDVDVNGTSWLVQELVNGDAGVCSVGTPGGSEEITPSTTTTTTIDKGPLCSGGVKPSGVTGEAGGGGGSDSSSISVTQVLSTPGNWKERSSCNYMKELRLAIVCMILLKKLSSRYLALGSLPYLFTKNETNAPLHVATLTVQRELPKYEIIFSI